ncbi:RNA polymerase sigma factor [Caldisericum exile]|uniref:RNA polymerase ECF-type sigma factor n=1 Tax=Caldisericum exile (strain DSM 21853 / NBRC 104410 / AZM16c01) TaxID=511051 RepID=A0A7U6GFB7_CALEA|nr:sigma-70 family RNA polymerase sigma factor [Caldisericum exile]BAL81355.1 RNA polymerase ECF-type sigma factor [Caldisericum exile AZM16c01]
MDVEDKLKEIVPKVKQGDLEAFEMLYNLTYKYVYKIAYAITLSKEDAEDIVQNTYLKIYEKRKMLDNGDTVLGYIKRITINYALKNGKKQPLKFIEKESKNNSDDIKEIVEDALKQLDAKDRSIVTLFYIDNMTTKEIAFLLNESEENIRVRLHRARNKLREVIENGKV